MSLVGGHSVGMFPAECDYCEKKMLNVMFRRVGRDEYAFHCAACDRLNTVPAETVK